VIFFLWSRAVVFSIPRAPGWSCGALPSLDLGLVARRSSVSPGSAPMRVWFEVVLWEVLHSVTHAHHFSKCEMYRCASMLPVIDLAPRGEDGMVASVEETQPSAISTSSGRHSAALPIVGPPRGLLARVSREEKSFSGFLKVFCYNTLRTLSFFVICCVISI